MRFRGLQTTNAPVVVPHHVATDPELSMKAKGLFLVMLSWPVGEHLTVTGLLERMADGRDAVNAAWKELVDRGLLHEGPDGLHLQEIPESAPVRITENPQITEKPELRKSRKMSGAFSGKTETARVPSVVVDIPGDRETGSKSEEGDSARDLFGGVTDAERSKAVKFANSPLFKPDVFAAVFRREVLAGVDVEHYRTAIRRWSDKKHRRLHDFDGWRSILEDAMLRDRNTGKLRMVGQQDEIEARRSAEFEFLSMGR